MRAPHGNAQWIDRASGQVVLEYDTAHCGHCRAVLFVKPGHGPRTVRIWVRGTWYDIPGMRCARCQADICWRCDRVDRCQPFEAQIEAMER